MSSEPRAADLVVVGAGPAGLAAAATALVGGLTVTLLDIGHAFGGQFWRHPPDTSGGPARERLHHDLGTYRSLRATLDRYAASGALEVRLQHHVWTASVGADRVLLHAVDASGGPGRERAEVVAGRRLLVATGAYDRQLPFPGWDLPGVFTAGGLQALLKANDVAAGRRVVVAGTGPFLLPIAAGLADAGVRVLAVCEAAAATSWLSHAGAAASLPGKVAEGVGYMRSLVRQSIPYLQRTVVVAATGEGRVEGVRLARLGASGAPVPGSERTLEADAVGVGWGFVPQLDLALTLGCLLVGFADGNEVVAVDDWQRTSVPGVLASGETCGVGGAELALREGQLAAEGVLHDLGRPAVTSPAALRRVRRAVARHRAFARAMAQVHGIPTGWTRWLEEATTVCRCEEVSTGEVRAAVARGARDGRQVKQLTRAGMGWCQGRVCATACEWLAREEPEAARLRARGVALVGPDRPVPATERLVAAPVTLGALSRERGGAM